MSKRCKACRDGEHDNYDDDVIKVDVRDPDSGHLMMRGYLCNEHRTAYTDDCFVVRPIK